MNRFTDSLRSSVHNGDWYVSLATALTLPDVCGSLIDAKAASGARYALWFDSWMSLKHTLNMPMLYKDTYLSGSDCYGLRCKYLHQGSSDISARSKRTLDNFHFIVSPPNQNTIHMNRTDQVLQIQVDIFCLDMAASVDEWAESVANDDAVQRSISSLLMIHNLKGYMAHGF